MVWVSIFQIDPSMVNGGGGASMAAPSSVMSANYTVFQGTPSYVADLRMQSNLPNTASDSDIKSEILRRQSICLSQVKIPFNLVCTN